YPFHIQRVQALRAPDYDSRLAFCRFVLRKVEENQDFTANILFTDEAIFTNNGIINFHTLFNLSIINEYALTEDKEEVIKLRTSTKTRDRSRTRWREVKRDLRRLQISNKRQKAQDRDGTLYGKPRLTGL
ncbi:hypothetical protein X777_16242, partial [Ooceraea biroi]